MPELVATPADPDANSYLTLDEANEAMDGYLSATLWLNLEDSQRERLLLTGTRLIDAYKPWGPKSDPDQALSFPTANDKDTDGSFIIPPEAKKALLEYCEMMANGDIDHLKKLQAEGVTSMSMLGQNANVSKDESQLPALARKELDKLWARMGSPRLKNSAPYETPDRNSIFG